MKDIEAMKKTAPEELLRRYSILVDAACATGTPYGGSIRVLGFAERDGRRYVEVAALRDGKVASTARTHVDGEWPDAAGKPLSTEEALGLTIRTLVRMLVGTDASEERRLEVSMWLETRGISPEEVLGWER